MTKKIGFSLAIIGISMILPLAGNLHRLLDYRILIIVIAIFLINLTQPAFSIKEQQQHQQSDRFSILLIIVMFVLSILLLMLQWGYWPATLWPGAWLIWAGAAMIVAGLYIRISAIRHLGRYFTANVQSVEAHHLITDGPYKTVRHPSYLGALLTLAGFPVLLGSLPGFLVALILMMIAYHKRIKVEEALLVQLFKDEYKQYQQTTYRMIPYVW
jgi:protein-S-isoprenylcysteine O-methyltransferase Ste14